MRSKHTAFGIGMVLAAFALIGLLSVPAGQQVSMATVALLATAFAIGFSLLSFAFSEH
jgi:hypothetical protein